MSLLRVALHNAQRRFKAWKNLFDLFAFENRITNTKPSDGNEPLNTKFGRQLFICDAVLEMNAMWKKRGGQDMPCEDWYELGDQLKKFMAGRWPAITATHEHDNLFDGN